MTNIQIARGVVLASVAALLLSGCQFQRAETARQAQRSMVGMSKERVLACMGAPASKDQAGQTEVWSYPSGGEVNAFSAGSATGTASSFGSTTTANIYGSSVSNAQMRSCVVNVVFQGSSVQAVNYTGRTGGLLTQGEQCAFAIQNCVR